MDNIYLYFAKAFDLVNHDHLIFKLFNFGLTGGTLHWIAYFKNKELCVGIKANVSDPFLANCGVPQRAHFGPLLFIIFFNDIFSEIKYAKFQIYADKIKIYHCIYKYIYIANDQMMLQNKP